MSYGVVRVQKFSAGSVAGIQIHDRRDKDRSHTNPDIDFSRSHENYTLHLEDGRSFYVAAQERIKALALPKAVRKDAVVMAQVLVTSDKAFFDGLTEVQQKQFFRDSYSFLAERYGAENVISSTVHMDEKTPHMHFNFVPVTPDGRLSAKDLLNRQSLIEQQTAFYERVGKAYGLHRGEPRGSGKRRKHLETAEYKKFAAHEQKIRMAIDVLHQSHDNARFKLEEVRREVDDLQGAKEGLKRNVDVLRGIHGGMVLTQEQVDSIQPEKGLMPNTVKNVTLEDIENLKKTAMVGAIANHSAKQYKAKYEESERVGSAIWDSLEKVTEERNELKKQIPSRIEKAKQESYVNNLVRENTKLKNALDKLPNEIKEQLFPPKNRGYDLER